MTDNGRTAPSVADLGRALAEPNRLRILQELLGGPPLTAGTLAARTGLAPSTTSAHLARLHDAGLIELQAQGRSWTASVSRPEVAGAVEALLRLTGEPAVNSVRTANRRTALREARSCYDHVAGRLGVALCDFAFEKQWVIGPDDAWTLARDGLTTISATLNLNLKPPASRSRPAVRTCQDWTERRPHLAGHLGASLFTAMLEADWVRRRVHDRALALTDDGRTALSAAGIIPEGVDRQRG